MSGTTSINIRELGKEQKQRIRELLCYGDIGKIAIKCKTVGYQRVSDVIRTGEDHDEIWKVTLEYLSSAGNVDIDQRLAKIIKKQEAT